MSSTRGSSFPGWMVFCTSAKQLGLLFRDSEVDTRDTPFFTSVRKPGAALGAGARIPIHRRLDAFADWRLIVMGDDAAEMAVLGPLRAGIAFRF